jgi:DNA polymerase-3 subunit epsilon
MESPTIAVVDVETTGLQPTRHDRVVEIGAVVIDLQGRTLRTFESLVNPQRDIGPTSIHGLQAGHVLRAPTFAEIAPAFLDVIDGTVALAAHNADFDARFLRAEFARAGIAWEPPPLVCTMTLAGGRSLATCCDTWGVDGPRHAHSAQDDALAAARLLARLVQHHPGLADEWRHWPERRCASHTSGRAVAVTRAQAELASAAPPDFLSRLVARVGRDRAPGSPDPAQMAYARLLDRVLEDRCVDAAEASALIDLARERGLSGPEIVGLHRAYVAQLVHAARADGQVTEAEARDLQAVGRLLGVDPAACSDAPASLQAPSPDRPLTGESVCFTGELRCTYRGQPITRQRAMELAAERGMIIADGVSKSLSILVVADGDTQSGKAKKARKYGTRIVHEAVFWRTLGVEVS